MLTSLYSLYKTDCTIKILTILEISFQYPGKGHSTQRTEVKVTFKKYTG